MVRGEPADINGDGKPETLVERPEALRSIARNAFSTAVIQSDPQGNYRLVTHADEDGPVIFVKVLAVGPPRAQMEITDANRDGCFESREISIYSMDGLMLHRATDTDEDCDGVFTRVEEWTESATTE